MLPLPGSAMDWSARSCVATEAQELGRPFCALLEQRPIESHATFAFLYPRYAVRDIL